MGLGLGFADGLFSGMSAETEVGVVESPGMNVGETANDVV